MRFFYFVAALAALALVEAGPTYSPNEVEDGRTHRPEAGPTHRPEEERCTHHAEEERRTHAPSAEGTKRPRGTRRPAVTVKPEDLVDHDDFTADTEGFDYIRPKWEKLITEYIRHKSSKPLFIVDVLPGSNYSKHSNTNIDFHLVANIGHGPCTIFEILDKEKQHECQDNARATMKCDINIHYDGKMKIKDALCKHF